MAAIITWGGKDDTTMTDETIAPPQNDSNKENVATPATKKGKQ